MEGTFKKDISEEHEKGLQELSNYEENSRKQLLEEERKSRSRK